MAKSEDYTPLEILKNEMTYKQESLRRHLASLQVDVERAVRMERDGRTVGVYSLVSTMMNAVRVEAELQGLHLAVSELEGK